MNLLIFILLTLLYIIFMRYLILKLIDIFKNNNKYDRIKGWDNYRQSFWYKKESDYYRLGSRNHWAPILTNIPMCAVLIGLYDGLTICVQKFLIAPKNALIVFRTDSYFLGIIGLLFFAIIYVFGFVTIQKFQF